MHKTKIYYVYITASISRVLYTGVTKDLSSRMEQHKSEAVTSSFTKRYRVNRLVYYEEYRRIYDAIDKGKADQKVEARKEAFFN